MNSDSQRRQSVNMFEVFPWRETVNSCCQSVSTVTCCIYTVLLYDWCFILSGASVYGETRSVQSSWWSHCETPGHRTLNTVTRPQVSLQFNRQLHLTCLSFIQQQSSALTPMSLQDMLCPDSSFPWNRRVCLHRPETAVGLIEKTQEGLVFIELLKWREARSSRYTRFQWATHS